MTEMKCIEVSGYGDVDEMISMSLHRKRPIFQHGKGLMMVRILACALAPGDCRVLSGKTAKFQGPKDGFPYIPGGDLCGIVEEIDDKAKFRKNDVVVVMFDIPAPFDGLAEFALVKVENAVLKAANVSPEEGCALTSSAVCAWHAAHTVKSGERVLVIGGSGGVGCMLVQLLRYAGASFIAAVSTDEELLTSLGVDHVVNYRKEDWTEVEEFQTLPFDVVIDCVGGPDAWRRAKKARALKNGWKGGRYIAMVGDNPYMDGSSTWALLRSWFLPMASRHVLTHCWPFVPKYKLFLGLDFDKDELTKIKNLTEEGHLRPVLDRSAPFAFTAEDVKRAYRLQESRHAHGKVVIKIADLSTSVA